MVYARRASDKCSKEKRKTINGDDLLWAMSALGFEEYVEPLKMYLHKYREVRFFWPPACLEMFHSLPYLDSLLCEQGEKASLAKQGQEANGMKKEEPQPQHLMYTVSALHEGHTEEMKGNLCKSQFWNSAACKLMMSFNDQQFGT